MGTFRDRYTALHFSIFNFLARLLGVGSLLSGIMGLLTFLISPEHPLLALALGILGIVCGVLFLRLKRLEPKDAQAFMDRWHRR